MKVQTWEQDGDWYWSIFDEYGDELASDGPHETRALAREELYAAVEDFKGAYQ